MHILKLDAHINIFNTFHNNIIKEDYNIIEAFLSWLSSRAIDLLHLKITEWIMHTVACDCLFKAFIWDKL